MSARECIILNPRSGSKGRDDVDPSDLFETAGAGFHRLGPKTDLARTVQGALDGGCDIVIAAGGDGTISGVAEHVSDRGIPLGVVPLGTFNYFARSLCIPEDPQEALHWARNGVDKALMVGDVNGRKFINNASLGAYAAVLEVREDIYRNWGRSRLAAYWSVIVAMATLYRPLRMRITVDGEVHDQRSPMAFVAICPYQLDEFGLEGSEAVRDGKLALFVARDAGRLTLFWRAIRIFFKGARKNRDYTLHIGSDILIETSRRHRLVARDGEREPMPGPYRFRALKDALRVRVPRSGPQEE